MHWYLYVSLSLIACLSVTETQAQPLLSPVSARIVFYRDTGALKSAAACKIYLGDSLLAKVNTKSAWTAQLVPGAYTFQTVLSLDNQQGQPLSLTLESGKLYLVEIKLQGSGHQQAIPSAGYSFRLNAVVEKRYKSLLKQKAFAEALRQALYEEMLDRYPPH